MTQHNRTVTSCLNSDWSGDANFLTCIMHQANSARLLEKQWRFQSKKDWVGKNKSDRSEKTLSSALVLLGKLLNASGNEGYNATWNLITFSRDMWHPSNPDKSLFDFLVSIFNHFHNKIVSAQRNIRAYRFFTLNQKKLLLQSEILICT